jgi:adenine/guanine phosphoribosyltransferase-like PRPP-binding protein
MTTLSAVRPAWPGRWLCERMPATLSGTARQELGLALRRNPRRAHLLVSRVLGKHVPVAPGRALAAGHRLGRRVRQLLHDCDTAEAPLVIGYAETATALGHCVADMLPGATCIQSTRRRAGGVAPVAEFSEVHSHATGHLLLPADPGLLQRNGPIVLVDDELSTGRTVANTIRALDALHPGRHYVVATLVDATEHEVFTGLAAELSVRISVAAEARARLTLPADAVDRGSALAERYGEPPRRGDRPPVLTSLGLPWPKGLPETARHGWEHRDRVRFEQELPAFAERVPRVPRLLVLGTEELMYVPMRLAAALAARGSETLFASTTRSPVVPVDQPGYAIRNAITFGAADGEGPRFAYNIADLSVDAVLVVVDPAIAYDRLVADGGLVPALGAVSDRVLLVTVGDVAG